MAANDYYNLYPQSHTRPYHDRADGTESPLPPLPYQSPFNDSVHRLYSHETPAPSYSGASGRINDDSDPFDDGHAIPLNGRKPKHESTQTISPILPHEQDDPFVRDADPRKQKRRRSSGEGWFKGKITWVVFILSFVQLVVFIAEIIRNGKGQFRRNTFDARLT